MTKIPSTLGLWIIEAYCRLGSTVQVEGFIGGESYDSSAVITGTSPIDLKMRFESSDALRGQRGNHVISLLGAIFYFDSEPKPHESANPDWRSQLRVQFQDQGWLLIKERFLASAQ